MNIAENCADQVYKKQLRDAVIIITHTSPIAADITITYNTVYIHTPLTPL